VLDQSSRHTREFQLPSDLKGFRCSVLGLARSGLALAKVLIPKGAKVFLSDSRSADVLQSAQAEAESLGAEVETGGHTSRLLDCDCLIISPGVSVHAEIVQRAISQGVPVVSEVEIAHHMCPWPMIAVTGTNGKSTTCSLVQEFLAPKSFLAGNIGLPLVSEVDQHRDDPAIEWAVVEISSFQLETVHRFAPRVAVLTNITPDHLDRHRTVAEYAAAKARIFAQQLQSDIAIVNLDDELAKLEYDKLLRGQQDPLAQRVSHAKSNGSDRLRLFFQEW
jgi:UDP-N-acetylmuramoylalanine--D-glutamate ligase